MKNKEVVLIYTSLLNDVTKNSERRNLCGYF